MVDDYLETCKAIGKKNHKKYTVAILILEHPLEIHQKHWQKLQKIENVSLNKLIIAILLIFVEDSENKDNKLYNHVLKRLSNA